MLVAAAHLIASAKTAADDSAVFDTLSIVVGTILVSLLGWIAKKLVSGASDMHRVLVVLVGEKPDKFNQNPDKGMIETVADHTKQLESQDKKLDALMKASRANLTEGAASGPESRAAVRQIDETRRSES